MSLGVSGSLLTCTTQSVAKSLADLEVDAATGALAVDLAVDPRHESWLTWAVVGELSETLSPLTGAVACATSRTCTSATST